MDSIIYCQTTLFNHFSDNQTSIHKKSGCKYKLFYYSSKKNKQKFKKFINNIIKRDKYLKYSVL
uniref:Uncharacterized protein n=1 Tax=uncultured Sphingobacteriales bacterium HF0130_33B19 TaxID=710991 RepID=E0XTP5_9SPHI|nr:hypothetical protein [uncultured Sphingobacteriales bacterium HF0130_33B19]